MAESETLTSLEQATRCCVTTGAEPFLTTPFSFNNSILITSSVFFLNAKLSGFMSKSRASLPAPPDLECTCNGGSHGWRRVYNITILEPFLDLRQYALRCSFHLPLLSGQND